MGYKGDKNRLKGSENTAYDNSVLWENIDSKKLEQAKKEGRIKILEEQIKEHGIEVLEVRNNHFADVNKKV